MADGCSSRVKRDLCTGFGLVLLFALASVPAGRSQTPGQNAGAPDSMRPYYPGSHTPMDNNDGYDTVAAERRLKALNIERQKQMVSDTVKLLKLARELNAEVAAQNTGALTDEQLHKVAEIEKLARNVKERMAEGVVQPVPAVVPAPFVYSGP